LSNLKNLARQTLWYGVSTIAARFINLLLTPYLTRAKAVDTSDYGRIGIIYAAITILKVLFTYGFETAYFRFSGKEEYKKTIYSTAFLSLFSSTVFFTAVLWACQTGLAKFIRLEDYPDVVRIAILIIALDTLNVIPLAKLRQEGRPIKYAFVNVGSILANIFFTWFFISFCPSYTKEHPDSIINLIYHQHVDPVVYVMLANLIQSAFALVLLSGEIKQVRLKFDPRLWKEMLVYSAPLIIAGLGGMINETCDRLMLGWWLHGDQQYRNDQIGIYNACYKLSILISLSVQAFRMGAEPFFFKQAEGSNPQLVYARVMKFFVIVVSLMFLGVSMYIPIWQVIVGENYRVGLGIVPILLMANICLGIYYNLTIWYKLANRTGAGATITLIGAGITLLINFIFIPMFGFYASAWATFFCYFSMMVISFIWGQKVYYVPYAWKKLLAYLIIVLILFFIHKGITAIWDDQYHIFGLTIATILTLAYVYFVIQVEHKEFERIPVLNKFVKRKQTPSAP